MSIPAVLVRRRCLTGRRWIVPFGFALLMAAACESKPPRMLGEENVLVVADDALWAEIQDTLKSALKPRLPGLPPENTHRVSQASSAAVSENDLSRFLQIVVLGRSDDVLVSEILRSSADLPDQRPALLPRADVWAPGQRVTTVVLPEEGGIEEVLPYVDTLAGLVDDHYRDWTKLRMYALGVNPDIAGELATRGIRLEAPGAFRGVLSEDSVYRFMTFGNDQLRLVRSVLITWSPLDESVPSTESVLAWRQTMADRFYEDAQVTPPEFVRTREIGEGTDGIEVSGAWNGIVKGQPHAGPFVTRIIDCADQGRRYLLDAWLFAPSREKYTYLIQLEAVLDSFGCVGE